MKVVHLREVFPPLRTPDCGPVVGLVGVSGSGKTTTLDALFRRELARPDGPLRLTVVDAPGLGEDAAADAEHLRMYNRRLHSCDVVLWVLAARHRALALDRDYLRRLRRFADRIVFGVNQVDLLEPGDWNATHNVPSERQSVRIADITEHRRGALGEVLGRDVPVVAYSALRRWGLDGLAGALLDAVPPDRRSLLESFRRHHHPEDP